MKGDDMSSYEDETLTMQELSNYLRLTDTTLYRLMRRNPKALPGRKIGGRWRFSLSGIDAMLLHQSMPKSATTPRR